MDLLFRRYASPFSLLTEYIQTCRFYEFIQTLCRLKRDDDRYEYYIHRVWDKSYGEFCDILDTTEKQQGMSDHDMETTIMESMKILNNFKPEQEEGEE